MIKNSKYVTIPFFVAYRKIMYFIKIGQAIYHQTDDPITAWASYRSLLRRSDFTDGMHYARLEQDGVVLDERAIDTQSANMSIGTDITPNQVLGVMMEGLQLNDLYIAVQQSKLNASKSKIKGWLIPPDNRKHQKMFADELYLVLPHLFSPTCKQIGYTPDGLKKLVKMTKLSVKDFCAEFDLPQQSYFSAISSTQSHRSMSYKTWSDLQDKVALFLLNSQNNA